MSFDSCNWKALNCICYFQSYFGLLMTHASRFSHLFLKQMQWLRLNAIFCNRIQSCLCQNEQWTEGWQLCWWVKLIAYSVHVFHLTLMFPMPHTTYLWNCTMHNINTTLGTFFVFFFIFVFHKKCIQPKMPPLSTIP